MKILKTKTYDDALKHIAGEILNIEAGLFHFIDGEPAKLGENLKVENYVGYPRLIVDDIRYDIKSASGYLYVPLDISGKDLVHDLKPLLEKMSKFSRLDGKSNDHLRDYHTIKCGYNTNIKIKHDLKTKKVESRVFLYDETDSHRGRFTWFIVPINKINFEIVNTDVDRAIARFASCILWDRYDITKLLHNDSTFEFNINSLRGYEHVLNKTIILFKHAENPLMIELNNFWRNYPFNNKNKILRNINDARLYKADYNKLQFKTVRIDDTSSEVSNDICARCKQMIYGDFYALGGYINGGNDKSCIALCALCMHSSQQDMPLENKYMRVYRTTCPRTIVDMLEIEICDDTKRDICIEVLNGITTEEIEINNDKVTYTLIGKKYAAFNNVENFLFTDMINSPIFKDRKICQVTFCQ
jgi:hypothetical protein